MGLAGRKVKQRIGADPRNLTWADDASRFGSSYLAKLGWDSSQGLGVSGEGRISHIKVSQKLDMLGIGAAQQRDPNGIAWKQNKDFESVLARLNAAAVTKSSEDKEEEREEEEVVEPSESQVEEKKKEKKKKRKAEGQEDEKKAKKRKKDKGVDEEEKPKDEETAPPAPPAEEPKKPYIPRVKAHRARNVASKNLASKSASAIAEILGVAPSTSTTPSSSTPAQTSGSLTPITGTLEPLENLTTSTKSVSDYFKERLAAKSGFTTPRTESNGDGDAEAPRGGLGSSRLRFEALSGDSNSNESMFSSLKSSSFLAATMMSTALYTEEKVQVLTEATPETTSTEKKKSKKSKKEKEDKAPQEPEIEESEHVSEEEAKRLKAQRKAEKAQRKLEREKRRQLQEKESG